MSNLTITVAVVGGETVDLTGPQVGSFLVHKSICDEWCVTHIASGTKFPWIFRKKREAIAFARAVEPVMDWSAVQVQSVGWNKTKFTSGAPTQEQCDAIDALMKQHGGIR